MIQEQTVSRVLDAALQTGADFAELFAEYSKFQEITRQRLFYETIAQVFPDMKIIITGKDGSQMTTVLPLDSFVNADDGEPREEETP